MRNEGWESALNAHLEAARTTEFKWGTHDCALWSAQWVAKATDNDQTGDWTGNYSTEDEADAIMFERGFTCPADIADAHLSSIAVSFAQRGDLILNPAGCIGICNGRLSVFVTPFGVTTVETLRCPRAWRVE